MLKNNTNPVIPLGIAIIGFLVFILSWMGLFDIIRKYHKMRGIITDNHVRNFVLAVILGAITGIVLQRILF